MAFKCSAVLIRTYLEFYLEYKHNFDIVGKVKLSSSFGGLKPPQNGLKPPLIELNFVKAAELRETVLLCLERISNKKCFSRGKLGLWQHRPVCNVQ